MRAKVKCSYCGKTFIADRSDKKYCSIKCRRAANGKKARERYKVKHQPVMIKCEACGKDTVRISGNSKYCKECSKLIAGVKKGRCHNAPKYIIEIATKANCAMCNKSIVGQQLYKTLWLCSSCFKKIEKKNKKAEEGKRICVICGNQFRPNEVRYDAAEDRYHVAGRITCSIACTDKLYGYKPNVKSASV